MNSNSNLQKSLKKAFEEHREPLHEAQWDRLSAALGDKRPKRRIFPWILGLAMVVTLSLVAGYWMGKDSGKGTDTMTVLRNDNSVADRSRTTELNETPPAHQGFELNESTKGSDQTGKEMEAMQAKSEGHSTDGRPDQNTGKEGTQTSGRSSMDKGRYQPSARNGQNGKRAKGEGMFARDESRGNGVSGPEKDGGTGSGISAGETAGETANIHDDVVGLMKRPLLKLFNAKTYTREVVSEISSDKFAPGEKKNRKDKEGGDVPEFSRFAIGFTTGISHAVYQDAVFSDPDKMHRDTRLVYDGGNQASKTSFANLFFDVKVLKHVNLTFNSGIQYRQLQSTENTVYKYNNIPFRDTNGGIFGYLFVPDSANPETFRNSSVHTTRFMAIPLMLGYTLPIGSRNELQLNGGVVLNRITSVKGSSFSVNEAEVIDIRNRYSKKTGMGYMAGISFYRCIYGAWWLGAGIQFQQNKTIFDTPYGTISSRINITNYAFNIKYKF